MSDLKNSAATMRPVKNELMDLDGEDVLCGNEVNECMMDDAEDINTSKDTTAEADPSNMQPILCTDNEDNKMDDEYMKLLDSFSEERDSYLSDNPLRVIRYDVDNGGYDKREFKPVTNNQQRRSGEDRNITRVTKKNVEASTKKSTKELRGRRETSEGNVEASKESSEGEMVLDKNYRSYLTCLVENSKRSRTSSPDKEIQVKSEEYTMSLSDSDIIAVDDRPFVDEEYSPFVPSKNYQVVDVEEDNGEQRPSWFRKEILTVLKQPYNEEEFTELKREASERKWLTRCRELRDGRDLTYTTNETRPSYLEKYPVFKRKLEESLLEKDRHGALNLLRGFFFYLKKVAHDDAFQPWLDPECLKIRCFEQEISYSSSTIKREEECQFHFHG